MACLAVLLRHTDAGLSGGGRGVDVFFVLSGYLITSMLMQGPSLASFWERRARRLLPALVFFVACYVVLWPLVMPSEAAGRWRDALLALTYTHNLAMMTGFRMSGLAHVWSLAVEAQFYLLWPLVLPFVLRLKSPALWLLLTWAGLTLWRQLTPDPDFAYYAPHLHATGLILGAVVAIKPPSARFGWPALAVLALAFWFGARSPEHWSLTLAEVSTAFLIPALLSPGRLQQGFSWKPLVWVGLVSYGVYLWHYPIAYALKGWAWNTPATLALSLTFAALSYYTVEHWAKVAGRRVPIAGAAN